MKSPLLPALALSLAALHPAALVAQPTAIHAGDIARVRDCSALIATYPAMRVDPNRACAGMACASGLSVDTRAVAHGAGSYRIEIEADGQRFTCDARLPHASCDDTTLCTWTRPGGFHRVTVAREGCMQPAAEHAFASVDFEGLCPAHVGVRVLRDGREVGRYDSAVGYRRVVANGEGCGPVCAQGVAPITSRTAR